MRRAVAVWSFLLWAVVSPVPARAAGSPSDEQRATELYNRSDDAYRAGRFKEAIDLLKKAYRLTPDAILLYNLARTYEGLGDFPNALESYSGYLSASPNAKDRASVEQRIAALRAGIEEKERLRRERAAAEARERNLREQAVRRGAARSPSVVPWVIAGVGGAALAAGAVFGLTARSRSDTAATAPQIDVPRDNSDAHAFATLANVSFAVGGVLFATGAVWGVLDVRAASRSRSGIALLPWVAPGTGGLVLRVE